MIVIKMMKEGNKRKEERGDVAEEIGREDSVRETR